MKRRKGKVRKTLEKRDREHKVRQKSSISVETAGGRR